MHNGISQCKAEDDHNEYSRRFQEFWNMADLEHPADPPATQPTEHGTKQRGQKEKDQCCTIWIRCRDIRNDLKRKYSQQGTDRINNSPCPLYNVGRAWFHV